MIGRKKKFRKAIFCGTKEFIRTVATRVSKTNSRSKFLSKKGLRPSNETLREAPGAMASGPAGEVGREGRVATRGSGGLGSGGADRKSTRLNSSHSQISYAVFCLKKKK